MKRILEYKPNYYVSDTGSIFSDRTGVLKELIPFKNYKGYSYVSIRACGKTIKRAVHRLVAEMFIHNNNNKRLCVNHKDANKENNSYSNLEWCTYQENTNHALKYGLIHIGEKTHSSKLTEKNVLEIINLLELHKDTEIGQMYGVHRRTISDIRHNKTWRHVRR
jgi:hypothetical protein